MQQCNLCMRETRCLLSSTVLLRTDLELHTEVHATDEEQRSPAAEGKRMFVTKMHHMDPSALNFEDSY